jgi:hypothetical protein
MCGNGKYVYRDTGDVYEGGWADGFREGFGKLTKANGDVFVGQCALMPSNCSAFHAIRRIPARSGRTLPGRYEAGELIKKVQLDKRSFEMGVVLDSQRFERWRVGRVPPLWARPSAVALLPLF